MALRTLSGLALAPALALLVLVGFAGPASAAAVTFSDRTSFDPTGQVFDCLPVDLTVTGGVVNEVFHGVTDPKGVTHITGTIVPHNVTLTDGTTSYILSGASWFGASGSGDTATVMTETDHFVIRYADGGGVYAKVQMVTHQSPNGKYFVFDRGTCVAPNG